MDSGLEMLRKFGFTDGVCVATNSGLIVAFLVLLVALLLLLFRCTLHIIY